MSTEICYPKEKTWYIGFETASKLVVKAYEHFETNECLFTYWDTVELFTIEQMWIDRLAEYGITPLLPPKQK
jgi:hypothetical protein